MHSISAALVFSILVALSTVGASRAEQPPAPAAAAPAAAPMSLTPGGAYDVVAVQSSDMGWNAIRYHRHTGKASKLQSGYWVEIPDSSELPRSEYRVVIVPLRDDWGAVRLDVHSGQSWVAAPEGWQPVKDGQPPSPAE
ncbi:MAG TPA: hypothetical protein VEC57_05055 [Candidatus Limnocylindrales bacterium]|nr:hypothetical protein [Candidatus Limnocylindrales bacterium]